jgi:dTMP kinase
MGFFITFEGIDGVGKTTLIGHLERMCMRQGLPVTTTREPGATVLGDKLHSLLRDTRMCPLAEVYLFQADRAQHFKEVVLPALDRGGIVFCDRCLDSTYAYQAVGKDVSGTFVDWLSNAGMQGCLPNLTFVLDLEPEEAMKRGAGIDMFDLAPLNFQRKIREAFLNRAYKYPERFKILDASQPAWKVYQDAYLVLQKKGILA